MGDFLPILRWLGVGGFEKRLMATQKNRDVFVQELIEENRRRMGNDEAEGKKKKTMVEVLLTLQESEPEYYTDRMIRGIMKVRIRALVSFTFGYLLSNLQTIMEAKFDSNKEKEGFCQLVKNEGSVGLKTRHVFI